MMVHPLIIGKERVETDQSFDVVNPYTADRVAHVAMGSEQTFGQAIAAAQSAFEQNRSMPRHQRSQILLATATAIARRKDQFVSLMIAEAGKPVTLAEAEVDRAVITFTAAADEARRETGELLPADAYSPGAGYSAVAKRFPLGVIYGITPFNFPLNLVAHKVAPALASGNSIIIKPSPRTPLCSLLLAEVLLEAGLPPGLINVVTCPNELADCPLRDDRIRHLSFTGSADVGWKLRDKSCKRGVTLELGGNAAVIVHDDADLSAAIPAIAGGAFAYAGQSCISVQRVFVQRNIYAAFTDQLIAYIRDHIHTGDPKRRDVINGPMISVDALRKTEAAITQAVAAGAKISIGGKIAGPCYQPTVIENANSKLDVNAQELFAPVMTLQSYGDFAEAISMVNDSRYGLQAGVFTRDIGRANIAFEQLEVGGVIVNQVPTFRLDHLPYGGVKDSGLGREGVRWAMEAMTELRTMIVKQN